MGLVEKVDVSKDWKDVEGGVSHGEIKRHVFQAKGINSQCNGSGVAACLLCSGHGFML